jgi:hypothetical protein
MARELDPELRLESVSSFEIGNQLVFSGKLTKDTEGAPDVYAAGFSLGDLRRCKCGFGVSKAEATADLLRLLR